MTFANFLIKYLKQHERDYSDEYLDIGVFYTVAEEDEDKKKWNKILKIMRPIIPKGIDATTIEVISFGYDGKRIYLEYDKGKIEFDINKSKMIEILSQIYE